MAGRAQPVSRREAMKIALKGSAYAAPVVLSAIVPPAVAAGSPVLLTFASAPGSPFAVGNRPTDIVVGDFNGDGKLDFAVTNVGSNTVSVLLGDGRGGFTDAPGSPIPVGNSPFHIAVGDFNRDGNLDLAVTNASSNSVSVLLGNGRGGFTAAPGSPFVVDFGPEGIAVGDFNGDGKPDLAILTYQGGNHVSVLLGDGSGGFINAPGAPFNVGIGDVSIAVGDFNGDGNLDLAAPNAGSNTVSVLLGDGKGGFSDAPGSPIPVGNFPADIAVGDFNGDGKLDLAITNIATRFPSLTVTSNVSVLLGNGKGGFTAAPGSPFDVGNQPFGIAVGDFNGDRKLDLAVANTRGNNVSVLLGDGSGGFRNAPGSPISVGNRPTNIVFGDFNGDGKLDFAVTNALDNTVSVLLQQ